MTAVDLGMFKKNNVCNEIYLIFETEGVNQYISIIEQNQCVYIWRK